jgi:hypothetical protein
MHDKQVSTYEHQKLWLVAKYSTFLCSTGLPLGPDGCETQSAEDKAVFLLKTDEPPLSSSFTKSNNQNNILYSIKNGVFRVVYRIVKWVRIMGLVDCSSYMDRVAGAGIAGRCSYSNKMLPWLRIPVNYGSNSLRLFRRSGNIFAISSQNSEGG